MDDRPLSPDDLAPATLPADPLLSYNPDRVGLESEATFGAMEFATEAVPREPEGPEPPFRMVRPIAAGGMGEVWEAVQVSLNRVIAVKRIKQSLLGSSSDGSQGSGPQLLEAFRQEATTTANLEHPNIVPIHEVGADERGMPLIAMKLVKGMSWDREIAADFPAMPIPDFLAKHLPILISVCQAVSFAHSNGVVHRDLKPSQAMLGEFGEVLLMDWGLALVFHGQDLRGSRPSKDASWKGLAADTMSGTNPAGTPAYMAPEQTEETARNIGPWTDIFLLGATLYVLLTGGPPYAANHGRISFLRAKDGIVDPPENRVAGREVPPDLSRLCLRAMARHPQDRPETVKEFIDGLRDYLSGAGKRRESLALTAEVAKALDAVRDDYDALSGLAAKLTTARGLWLENPDARTLGDRVQVRFAEAALRANDLQLARVQAARLENPGERARLSGAVAAAEERRRSVARQRRQFIGASALLAALLVAGGVKWEIDQRNAREALAAQVDRANRARASSEELVNFMLTDLQRKLRPIGRLDVLGDVVGEVKKYMGSLHEDEESVDTERQRVRLANVLSDVNRAQGRLDQMMEGLGEAKKRAQKLIEENGPQPHLVHLLSDTDSRIASALSYRGDAETAAKMAANNLKVMQELCARPDATEEHWRDLAATQLNLSNYLIQLRRHDEARKQLQEGVELARKLTARYPDSDQCRRLLFAFYNGLGVLEYDVFNREESGRLMQQAVETAREWILKNPGAMDMRHDYAITLGRIADLHNDAGRPDDALASARESIAQFELLKERDPSNVDAQRELSVGYNKVAMYLRAKGKYAEAQETFLRSEAVMQRLSLLDPSNIDWRRDLNYIWFRLGELHSELGEWDKALEYHIKDTNSNEELIKQNPGFPQLRAEFQVSLYDHANCLMRLGRRSDAEAMFRRSVGVGEALLNGQDDDPPVIRSIGRSHAGIARARMEEGDWQAARDEYRKASALAEKALAARPKVNGWRHDLVRALDGEARACDSAGDAAGADAARAKAMALLDAYVAELPENPGWRAERADLRMRMALAAADAAAAGAMLDRAEEDLAVLQKAAPDSDDFRQAKGYHLLARVRVAASAGRGADAEPLIAEAEALARANMAARPADPEFAHDLASVLLEKGRLLKGLGRRDAAAAALGEAKSIAAPVAERLKTRQAQVLLADIDAAMKP